MISKIQNKIRNLIEDNIQSTFQAETAESGRTFSISQENTNAVTSVTVNGSVLDVADYTYDSVNQIVTIALGEVEEDDSVIICFTYYKYANTELLGFIKATLDWLITFDYSPDFILSTDTTELYPIPNIREQSLIAIISSILIKTNYSEKRSEGVTIKYPKTKTKEKLIENLIIKFKRDPIGYADGIDLTTILN